MRYGTKAAARGAPVKAPRKVVYPVGPREGVRVIDVRCGECKAEPGAGCITVSGQNDGLGGTAQPGKPMATFHLARRRMAQRKRNEMRGL